MSVRYRNSPVVEAILECFLAPGVWRDGSIDRLTKKFSESYSGQRDLVRSFVFKVPHQDQPPVPQVADRIRMRTTDASKLVQFAPDMIALNALPPYDTFPAYLPLFKELFDAYIEEAQATSVRVLGQRYLNRISLPSLNDHAADFFSMYPRALPDGHEPSQFSLQMETKTEAPGSLYLTLTFEGIHDARPRYLLDLYARLGDSESSGSLGADSNIPLNWNAIETWNQSAHAALLATFEASLTERARELLGREEV